MGALSFTGDQGYLKEIYPILKGAAEFYNHTLVQDQKRAGG
ncbi:hypothetical protein [Sphingobacterium sp. E70]